MKVFCMRYKCIRSFSTRSSSKCATIVKTYDVGERIGSSEYNKLMATERMAFEFEEEETDLPLTNTILSMATETLLNSFTDSDSSNVFDSSSSNDFGGFSGGDTGGGGASGDW